MYIHNVYTHRINSPKMAVPKKIRGMATFLPIFVTVDLQHLPQEAYIEGLANARLRFCPFS